MDLIEWENRFINYLKENPARDKSHDLSHFRRVWNTAQKFLTDEVDSLVVLAAAYFHDIVNYPKNYPNHHLSSLHAAQKAEHILFDMGFPADKIENVKHCIEAHSFSAKISPKTIEAKIVQDADRVEALGAIGLARTFYVAGRLGSDLFDGNDPMAEHRELNDKKYALDHFQVKLLELPNTMQTELGKKEAERRAGILKDFCNNLLEEIVCQ